MTLTNFIVATAVVIAATSNLGAEGFPKPQLLNIKLGSTDLLNLDPLGILFGKRTTKPAHSLHDPEFHRTTEVVPPVYPTPSPVVTQKPPTQSPVVDPAQLPSNTRPDIALCARNCKVTSQYNPVCGSDGVMYNNAELLMCTRDCGVSVTLLRIGRCNAPAPTDPQDTPTPIPESSWADVLQCARNCIFEVTSEYNPVCGSDGLVYNNAGLLTCANNCGISVTQLHTGRCSVPSPTVATILPTVATNPPTVATKRPTVATNRPTVATNPPTLSAADRCADNCFVTQEYNPVCGSNGITYRNSGLLICTKNCGINVTHRSYGPCIIEDPLAIDPRDGLGGRD